MINDKKQAELRNGTGDMKITADQLKSELVVNVEWEIRAGSMSDIVLANKEIESLVGTGLQSELVDALLRGE